VVDDSGDVSMSDEQDDVALAGPFKKITANVPEDVMFGEKNTKISVSKLK
jgi:hypothetical protein